MHQNHPLGILALGVLLFLGNFGVVSAQNQTSSTQDQEMVRQIVNYAEYPETALEEGREADVVLKFKTNENREIVKVAHRHQENDREFAEAAELALETFASSDRATMLQPNHVYTVPFYFRLD